MDILLSSPLFWGAVALVAVVVLVLVFRRESPSAFVMITFNGRDIQLPHSVREKLYRYLTADQRRFLGRVDRARLRGNSIPGDAERAYDAFIASAIRELIFHEPALAIWFVER